MPSIDERLRDHVARVVEHQAPAGFDDRLTSWMERAAHPNRRSWVGEVMAAAALVVLATGVFLAVHLSRQQEAVMPKPVATATALTSRPLRLPTLSPNSACPVTPVANVPLAIVSPRGGPIFYLGGPNPKGGFPWNKTVYTLVGAHGPVLLRGTRLDGSGTLKFDGAPVNRNEAPETRTSDGGVTRTFYSGVLTPGTAGANGSEGDVFYLYPSTAGCYALQADGNNFEAVVVFVATP